MEPLWSRRAGSWRSHAAATIAGQIANPVGGNGATRHFSANWQSCIRNTLPWDWTASTICLKPEFGCSRKRVHRQMRLAGIASVRRRAYKVTTNSRHSHPIAPNLLKRNFFFEQPNQAWVGDITYIPTGEGWLYLAIVKDLCTRKIVGYSLFQPYRYYADAGSAGHGGTPQQSAHGTYFSQ